MCAIVHALMCVWKCDSGLQGRVFHRDDTEKTSALIKSPASEQHGGDRKTKQSVSFFPNVTEHNGRGAVKKLVPSDRLLDQRDGDESSPLTAKHHTAEARQSC